MSLPLDLEDIFGVALVDLFRRVIRLMTCILFGSWMGLLAAVVGQHVAICVESKTWSFALYVPVLFDWFWAPIAPFFSWWAVLYGGTLLALAFYFAKTEDPGAKKWALLTALVALFPLLTLEGFGVRWDREYWTALGAGGVIWVGLSGSLFFLMMLWEHHQRKLSEQHFLIIAAENEERRQRLREEKGIEVAGREFVTGERTSPPPEDR